MKAGSRIIQLGFFLFFFLFLICHNISKRLTAGPWPLSCSRAALTKRVRTKPVLSKHQQHQEPLFSLHPQPAKQPFLFIFRNYFAYASVTNEWTWKKWKVKLLAVLTFSFENKLKFFKDLTFNQLFIYGSSSYLIQV